MLLAYIPYIKDILLADTRPHRTTWFIFSILAVGSFLSQVFLGAENSLWLIGVQCLAVVMIFLLSIKRGFGGFKTLDLFVLTLAIFGIVLWILSDDPRYTLYLNIGVGLIALVPTALKANIYPESETFLTWALGTVAGILGLFAASTTNLDILAYPLYVILVNGIIVTILLNKRAIRKS